MRTTLDIPEELLIAVEESSGASARRAAVVAAAGSLTFDGDPAELRAQDRKRVDRTPRLS